MEEKSSTGPMLYFIVGALLVAVIAVGYLAMKDDGGSTTNISVDSAPTSNAKEEPTSNFKIDIGKDGTVSGSLEKNID